MSHPFHCVYVGKSIFSVGGKFLNVLSPATANSPVVESATLSCATIAEASTAFTQASRGGPVKKVLALGDEARIINVSGELEGHAFVVVWREQKQVSLVLLIGAPKSTRVTQALAELLARRAAAGS